MISLFKTDINNNRCFKNDFTTQTSYRNIYSFAPKNSFWENKKDVGRNFTHRNYKKAF